MNGTHSGDYSCKNRVRRHGCHSLHDTQGCSDACLGNSGRFLPHCFLVLDLLLLLLQLLLLLGMPLLCSSLACLGFLGGDGATVSQRLDALNLLVVVCLVRLLLLVKLLDLPVIHGIHQPLYLSDRLTCRLHPLPHVLLALLGKVVISLLLALHLGDLRVSLILGKLGLRLRQLADDVLSRLCRQHLGVKLLLQ